MNDKISIIVPIFNIEGYVERCLRSLLQQTYTYLEVLAIDDGSTDGSGEILDRLATSDSRIKVIHKENGGVTNARMVGIENATGEWIGFVDGDDVVEADMFGHLLNNAVTHNADISHCGYQMIFPDGHIEYHYNTGCLVQQDRVMALKELLSGARIEPGLCNKLFRKTLFQSILHNDAIPRDIKINEDLLMNYLLFKVAKQTVYEDFCPYHYILRKGSAATSRNKHNLTDPLRVNEQIKNELHADAQLYPIAYSRYIYALIGNASQVRWKKERDAASKQLRREFRTKEISNCNSAKLRVMALGAGFAPHLYHLVRWIYDQVTGVSKKYDI